jgi:subtilisin family serine protease
MPPRKRAKKVKAQADGANERFTVVYIHGIGNKPAPAMLKRQYDQALFGIDMGGSTRLAYWADIRYPQPLPSGNVEGLSIASPEAFHPMDTSAGETATLQHLAPYGARAERYAAAVAGKLRKQYVSADRRRVNRIGTKILPGFIRKPVVEWLTKTFIEDTAAYFFDAEQRESMRQRLRQILLAQAGPYIVIAHSQGSIIAYDVLREFDSGANQLDVPLFVTIGSPLGLDEVQDHIHKPLRIPKVVQVWQNFADLLDPVAADKNLAGEFAGGARLNDHIVINQDTLSISRFNPHSGTGYLSTADVREVVRQEMGVANITPITPFVIARDVAAEMADPTARLSVLIELKDDDKDLTQLRAQLEGELRRMESDFRKLLPKNDRKVDHYKIDPLRRYVAASLTSEEIDQLAARHQNLQIASIWKDSVKRSLLDKSTHVVQAHTAQLGYGATGKNVAWAILDTGIRADHSHFSTHKNIVSQWDCTAVGAPVGAKAADGDGHGTHVAGIIAGVGKGDNGKFSGMAPETKLHIYKVLADDGTGSDSWIIKALDHIASINENAYELVIHGVNLSLGGPFDEAVFACGFSPICRELKRLWNQGVVVCIAAGNEGRLILDTAEGEAKLNLDLSIGDPANLEQAIAVGSVHREYPHMYGISFFSSRGPTADGRAKPDVVAPGEKIMSCNAGFKAGKEYIPLSGTSMACPHVSGIIAAFLSVRREFIGNPDRVKEILLANCTDLKRDRYHQGAGIPNLVKMLMST